MSRKIAQTPKGTQKSPVPIFVFHIRALLLYGLVWGLSWFGGLFSGSATTFLTFGSILALIVLGLCLRPIWVFIVGVAYSLGFLLTSLAEAKGLDPLAWTRSANVILAGGLAAWIAFLQKRSQKEMAEISLALLQLPLGVILSNHEGTIQFANGEACRLLALDQEDLLGRSFFSIFSVPEAEGNFLVDYHTLITAPANQASRVKLTSRRDARSTILATITPLKVSSRTLLLTTLSVAARSSAMPDQ
jgi:PAS domain-containing protein